MAGTFHFFLGADSDAVHEAAGAFLRKLCGNPPEENPDLEIIRGDSDTEDFAAILDSLINTLSTPPFLSPRKIVWLRHFDKFEEAQEEEVPKKRKTRLDLVADLFKAGLPDGMTAVVDGVGPDRKRSFYKTCAAVGAQQGNSFQWFDKIDTKDRNFGSRMASSARDYAAAEGKVLSEEAAVWLANVCGSDLARLRNEVLKLVCHAGKEERISVADCREICSASRDAVVWEFSSALTARDRQLALKLIPEILMSLEQESGASQGRPELLIISTVSNEFKRLLALKCLGGKLEFPEHANYGFFQEKLRELKESGIQNPVLSMHPFRVFRMWESCGRFRDSEFAGILDAISRANRAMVTGAPSRAALEALVLQITG